jgi:hypothetical protein
MEYVLHADRHGRGHAHRAVFVAFSLRVRELQLSPGLRTRARYLLLWLVAITIGSGLVLMPGQSRAALAAELLVVSVGCVACTVWSVLRTVRLELPAAPADEIGRFLGIGVTGLLSIGAGISLLAGHGGGLYLLAFAVLLGIALEVAAAWTLIVETGKHTRGQDVILTNQGAGTAGVSLATGVLQPALAAASSQMGGSSRPRCQPGPQIR